MNKYNTVMWWVEFHFNINYKNLLLEFVCNLKRMELKQKVGIKLRLFFIVNYVMYHCAREKIVIINITHHFHKYFCIYIIIFYYFILLYVMWRLYIYLLLYIFDFLYIYCKYYFLLYLINMHISKSILKIQIFCFLFFILYRYLQYL